MSKPVSLREFVDDLETVSDSIQITLNRQTGKFFLITEDNLPEFRLAEIIGDRILPEWEKALLKEYNEMINSTDYIQLPVL